MKGTLGEDCGSKNSFFRAISEKENGLLPLKPAAAGYNGIFDNYKQVQ